MSRPVADDPTVRRELDRSPAEVWEQLTSRKGFEHWMGPGSTIEPEPGGRLIAADPESGVPKTGCVLDADPERRLRWVWRPLGADPAGEGSTEVLVELEPSKQDSERTGTVITVVERPTTLTVQPLGVPTAAASVVAASMVGCR